MRHLMRAIVLQINGLIRDVFAIITSRERLRDILHISLYSNAIYYMLANGATTLLGFFFWVIVARSYSPADVGLASAAISASTLLAVIANLGLGYGLVRFLPSQNNANGMINSCLSVGSLAAILVSAVFLGGIQLWSPALVFIRNTPVYAIVFILFTLTFTLSQLTDYVFVAKRRAGYFLGRNLIFNSMKIPLLLLLAAFFQSFGIFTSWVISLTVALLVSIILFLPRVYPDYRFFFTIEKKSIKEISRFSFANYLSVLFWTSPGLILPIMVVNVLGTEPNAYFYIAWAIGNILGGIPGSVGTSLFAEGSFKENQLWINVWRGLKMSMLLLAPAVVLVLVFADKLLLLFGVSYSEGATTLLRLLAVSSFPLTINVIYLAIKRVEKNLLLIIGVPSAIMLISLVLSRFLLPRAGIDGAGFAWLIGQSLIALLIIINWLRKKYLKTGGSIVA